MAASTAMIMMTIRSSMRVKPPLLEFPSSSHHPEHPRSLVCLPRIGVDRRRYPWRRHPACFTDVSVPSVGKMADSKPSKASYRRRRVSLQEEPAGFNAPPAS